MWRAVGYRVSVENVYTRLTGGVEFSSLNRPVANLESVVVLEEKTSVRVKVVLVVSAALGGEVSSSVVKVFQTGDVDPQRGDGQVMYEGWFRPTSDGGVSKVA
jgi:hypothetical protein